MGSGIGRRKAVHGMVALSWGQGVVTTLRCTIQSKRRSKDLPE